ncbi:hypothetical protein GP486_000398 [Trichoglossum hirsutum]|uniref:Asl1-like glycosyl hydrolase catalytic domain-containing protein n=1 Tax=Trichoglossum hirsutum TaxID=265104 RepID=A0A9P8LHV4_9PEZI|nr:hypothetical protein GP486_000398 [Trichoglossum hirsutum]
MLTTIRQTLSHALLALTCVTRASVDTPSPSILYSETAFEPPTNTVANYPTETPFTSLVFTNPTCPAQTSPARKRGLAFNQASLTTDFGGPDSLVSWAYNWDQSCEPLGLEYVPMIWSLASNLIATWNVNAEAAIGTGSKHLLSFNEPDLSTQSNISPSDAAAGYKRYMQPFAGKAELGAPAVTNGKAPMGLTWLSSFLDECSECTIDFVPIHWYDTSANIEYFMSYVASAHAAAGYRPIWVTEFAVSGSVDQQKDFLRAVMPWLDSLDYVERYAYFGVFDGSLVNGNSKSALGDIFDTGR